MHKILQTGTSTTPMAKHLLNIHKISGADEDASAAAGSSVGPSSSTSTSYGPVKRQFEEELSQQKLTKFFKSTDSLQYYLAKWAAMNNFSVAGIVACDELAAYLTTRNMSMPKSTETVWKHIESFHELHLGLQNDKIAEKVSKGKGVQTA